MGDPIARPLDKVIVTPQTGRLTLEWDAFFSRIQSLINDASSNGVSFQSEIQALQADVAALQGAGSGILLGIFEDQKAQGTNGGSFNSGAWQTRGLNTEVYDRSGIFSLSGNAFTISQPGDYAISWSAPAAIVNQNQSRLYNVTNSSVVAYGSSMYAASNASYVLYSPGIAHVTLSGSTTFRIEHRCETSYAAYGFGIAANFATEVYTRVLVHNG